MINSKGGNPLVVMVLNNFFHGISNYNESISDRKYCHFISFPDSNVRKIWYISGLFSGSINIGEKPQYLSISARGGGKKYFMNNFD